MKFVQCKDASTGVQAIQKRLMSELRQRERAVWLITGGSSIPLIVDIMNHLPEEDTAKLTMFLTDERFGEVGHVHSNAKQLLDAGFTPKQATFVPVLQAGFTFAETQ